MEIALVKIYELISKMHTKKNQMQQRCIQSHAYRNISASYINTNRYIIAQRYIYICIM